MEVTRQSKAIKLSKYIRVKPHADPRIDTRERANVAMCACARVYTGDVFICVCVCVLMCVNLVWCRF